MLILNPNKYIREAYIEALELATGLNVWSDRMPKTVSPAPKQYILILNQSKNETVKAKSEGEKLTYFEWICTCDVHIFNINPKGYSKTEVVDDIEEKVISVIRQGIEIPNFSNKNTNIIESIDLDLETITESIDRRVIKFEHWLNRAVS